MIEVVVTTGSVRHAKLRSSCHQSPLTNQHPVFTGSMPFLFPKLYVADVTRYTLYKDDGTSLLTAWKY